MLTLQQVLSLELGSRIYRDGQTWEVVGYNLHNPGYSPAPIIRSQAGEVDTLSHLTWDEFSPTLEVTHE